MSCAEIGENEGVPYPLPAFPSLILTLSRFENGTRSLGSPLLSIITGWCRLRGYGSTLKGALARKNLTPSNFQGRCPLLCYYEQSNSQLLKPPRKRDIFCCILCDRTNPPCRDPFKCLDRRAYRARCSTGPSHTGRTPVRVLDQTLNTFQLFFCENIKRETTFFTQSLTDFFHIPFDSNV